MALAVLRLAGSVAGDAALNNCNNLEDLGPRYKRLGTTGAGITPPVKRLRAFNKVSLQPGESKTVTFTIAPRDLAFVGIENKWVTEPGDFEISVGGLKAGFTYLE